MHLKPALSIQEQLNLLDQRGLLIDNDIKAKDFLSNNQYYRLNIYFHKLMDSPNHFPQGTSFSQIMGIYAIDSWLRNHILSILEPIEIKTRTHIAYHLGMTYGPDAFYQQRIYKNGKIPQRMLRNVSREISRNRSDPVVKHHEKNYSGIFPIWVTIEYLSFNTLSKFYSCLQIQDTKNIANNAYSVNEYLLGQWLHVLSVLRNICAHYGYLYKRSYSVRPKIAYSFNWDRNNNNHLFAMFLVMQRLSNPIDWQNFIKIIIDKELASPFLYLHDYGFPKDWKTLLTM